MFFFQLISDISVCWYLKSFKPVAPLNFQSRDQTCLAIDGREDSNINDHRRLAKWDAELLPKYKPWKQSPMFTWIKMKSTKLRPGVRSRFIGHDTENCEMPCH
jgi:hypothetical protein